jgi:hypothetical protein
MIIVTTFLFADVMDRTENRIKAVNAQAPVTSS